MIDTHQHLHYPHRFGYAWSKDLPALPGNFRLEGYRAAATGCGIDDAVFRPVDVDAGQSGGEAQFVCKMARDAARVRGGGKMQM